MASSVPGTGDAPLSAKFENDVFVSYAHIDDQVLAEGQTGCGLGAGRITGLP